MTRLTSPLVSLASLAAAVFAASCYSDPPKPPLSPLALYQPLHKKRPAAQQVADLCPLRVADSVVMEQPVEHGVALVFTTPGDVADVRRRVRAMADLHDMNRDLIATTVRTRRSMHAAARYVEDVDGGARIVFRPPHETDLFEFRQEVGFEVMRLRAGECPMIMPERATPEGEPTLATASR
jgi:hypothetical protein